MPVEKIFKITQEGSDLFHLNLCDDGLFIDLSYNLSNFAILDKLECENLISFLEETIKKIEEGERFYDSLNNGNE
ncbi:MAG: hypothetical protein WAT92_00410 [Saprospiraceae bacterium]